MTAKKDTKMEQAIDTLDPRWCEFFYLKASEVYNPLKFKSHLAAKSYLHMYRVPMLEMLSNTTPVDPVAVAEELIVSTSSPEWMQTARRQLQPGDIVSIAGEDYGIITTKEAKHFEDKLDMIVTPLKLWSYISLVKLPAGQLERR